MIPLQSILHLHGAHDRLSDIYMLAHLNWVSCFLTHNSFLKPKHCQRLTTKVLFDPTKTNKHFSSSTYHSKTIKQDKKQINN